MTLDELIKQAQTLRIVTPGSAQVVVRYKAPSGDTDGAILEDAATHLQLNDGKVCVLTDYEASSAEIVG